jgi:hypothetical protein
LRAVREERSRELRRDWRRRRRFSSEAVGEEVLALQDLKTPLFFEVVVAALEVVGVEVGAPFQTELLTPLASSRGRTCDRKSG